MNKDNVLANCNDITSLTPTFAAANAHFKVLDGDIKFKIIMTKNLASSNIYANKYLNWNGSGVLSFCGPKQLKLCASNDCSVLSTSSLVSLGPNPTLTDSIGTLQPILTVARASAFNEYAYLEASNPSATSLVVKNVVKGLVIVCGNEKVVLKDTTNNVFNVRGTKNSVSPKMTFELKGIWELDSSQLL